MENNSSLIKLENVVEVQNGYAFKANDFGSTGIPVIKIKNIQPPNISFEDAQYYPGEINDRLKQFLIFKKDILISMTGSHISQISSAVGKVGRYGFNSPALLNQRVGKIYSKDELKLNNDFLYYLISRPEVQFELATNAGGSANQANISPQQIKSLEFEIPDITTQSRIASILSSLDDKIEVNRRMNHTLEQMAQALFNHYFVDNIDPDNLPEGWKVGKVGEILELKYGKALKENQRKIGSYAVVGSGGIIGYHDEFICKGKGVVVGRKGNSGAVSWLHEAFYPIDTTFYVSDLLGVKDLYYYYFLLKSLNLKNLNSDSAVPGLNRNEAHNQEIVIPNYKKINEFNNSVSYFFKRVNTNLKEIKTLTNIRDTLLPKLISGDIDVDALMTKDEQRIENFETA